MFNSTNYKVSQSLLIKAMKSLPSSNKKSTINQPTGNFFYDPWIIKQEYKDTVWNEILESLPLSLGEARIIILKHGTCYQSHGDIDDRYHLNITGQYSYIINLEEETMFPQINDGTWYEMDAGPRHTAANFGNNDRVQLVVRKLLNRNSLDLPVTVKLSTLGNSQDGIRFMFDDILSPWLNRANKLKVITDFDHIDNHVIFKIEKDKLSEFKNLLPKNFNIELL